MEEDEHRKRISIWRRCIIEKSKELRIENSRKDLRSTVAMYSQSFHQYLMHPNGEVGYRISLKTWKPEIFYCDEEEFRKDHSHWIADNMRLFETLTGQNQDRKFWEHPLLRVQLQGHARFQDMPLEVFEHLVWHLDVYSYHNMCRASSFLTGQLNESLTTNQRKKYLKLRKNDLKIDLAAKTISSFSNVLEPTTRRLQKKSDVDWPNIFEICANLEYAIEDSVLSLQSMDALEKSVKAELKLVHMYEFPQRMTIPCGSLLFNVYSQNTPNMNTIENIHIMEDMDPEKCYRLGSVCQYNLIQRVHIMSLQQCDDSFVNLIVPICKTRIHIYPLIEGQGTSISLLPEDELDPTVFTYTYSAVLRNIVGVAVHKERVELHRISYHERQVFAEILHKIHLSNFTEFFRDLYRLNDMFITAVKEIEIPPTLTEEEKSFYKAAQMDPPQVKGYALSFISCQFGNVLIRPSSSEEIQHIDYKSACKMSPKFYIGDYLEHSMKYPVGACSGCGMDIIWSDEEIAVSFDSVTWHLKSFHDGVRPHRPNMNRLALSITQFVICITVCSPNLILVAIDSELVFLRIRLLPTKDEDQPPMLDWQVIRRIELDLQSRYLQLKSLYFDFDRGEPYIFLELHKKFKLANPLKFYFQKIAIKQSDKIDDSGYLSD